MAAALAAMIRSVDALEDEHRLWVALNQRKRLIVVDQDGRRRPGVRRGRRDGRARVLGFAGARRQNLVLRIAATQALYDPRRGSGYGDTHAQ